MAQHLYTIQDIQALAIVMLGCQGECQWSGVAFRSYEGTYQKDPGCHAMCLKIELHPNHSC